MTKPRVTINFTFFFLFLIVLFVHNAIYNKHYLSFLNKRKQQVNVSDIYILNNTTSVCIFNIQFFR